MAALAQQRCFNHATREAVACCPGCRRFFCRECVTEHDDRVLCTACLAKLARPAPARTRGWVGPLAGCVAGIFLAWFFFFLIGRQLSRQPDSFHKTTLWQFQQNNRE